MFFCLFPSTLLFYTRYFQTVSSQISFLKFCTGYTDCRLLHDLFHIFPSCMEYFDRPEEHSFHPIPSKIAFNFCTPMFLFFMSTVSSANQHLRFIFLFFTSYFQRVFAWLHAYWLWSEENLFWQLPALMYQLELIPWESDSAHRKMGFYRPFSAHREYNALSTKHLFHLSQLFISLDFWLNQDYQPTYQRSFWHL